MSTNVGTAGRAAGIIDDTCIFLLQRSSDIGAVSAIKGHERKRSVNGLSKGGEEWLLCVFNMCSIFWRNVFFPSLLVPSVKHSCVSLLILLTLPV